MSSPQDSALTMLTTRRRGRPRAREPRSSVSAWILARHHDVLVHLANERSMSVSAVVRSLITKAVAEKPPES